MTNNLTRTEQLLGSPKNIIGNTRADLILESLGKVYVKTGKKTRLLNEVFKLLDGITESNISSRVIITNSLNDIKYPGDGYLVFDSIYKALYLTYDDRYILILDSIDKQSTGSGEFVKKSGDTMTGQLTIKHNGAPLIVASSELVENFNANYLGGYSSSDFAKKELDEFISGNWTFEKSTSFKNSVTVDGDASFNSNVNIGTSDEDLLNVRSRSMFKQNAVFEKDIISNGNIGTQEFTPGYNGRGWRISNDNMLTIDYLVVRKAMMVYELIVNRISATNGSLWVTDSCEVESAYLVDSEAEGWEMAYDMDGTDIYPLSFYKEGYDSVFVEDGIISACLLYYDSEIVCRNIYQHYYMSGNIYITTMKSDIIPTFKEGDLVRCQKFQDNNIKYYDGLVLAKLEDYTYAIQLSPSIFDMYTEITYDDTGKVIGESKINPSYSESLMTTVQPKDGLVRIGNIFNPERQNSVFITSSEWDSPYVQTMSGINRPDYSVVYQQPLLKKVRIDGVSQYVDIDGNHYKYITSNNYEYLLLESGISLNAATDIPLTDNFHIRARLGKLDGLTEETYGYGLFSDNVFLKGEFFLNNGQSIVEFTKEQISMEIAENKYSGNVFKYSDYETKGSWTHNTTLTQGDDTYIKITGTSETPLLMYQKSISTHQFTANSKVKGSIDIGQLDIEGDLMCYLAGANLQEISDPILITQTGVLEFTFNIIESISDQYIYFVISTDRAYTLQFRHEYVEYLDAIRSEFKQTADQLRTEISNNKNQISSINQTVNNITLQVENLEEEVASIEINPDEIAATVTENVEGNLQSAGLIIDSDSVKVHGQQFSIYDGNPETTDKVLWVDSNGLHINGTTEVYYEDIDVTAKDSDNNDIVDGGFYHYAEQIDLTDTYNLRNLRFYLGQDHEYYSITNNTTLVNLPISWPGGNNSVQEITIKNDAHSEVDIYKPENTSEEYQSEQGCFILLYPGFGASTETQEGFTQDELYSYLINSMRYQGRALQGVALAPGREVTFKVTKNSDGTILWDLISEANYLYDFSESRGEIAALTTTSSGNSYTSTGLPSFEIFAAKYNQAQSDGTLWYSLWKCKNNRAGSLTLVPNNDSSYTIKTNYTGHTATVNSSGISLAKVDSKIVALVNVDVGNNTQEVNGQTYYLGSAITILDMYLKAKFSFIVAANQEAVRICFPKSFTDLETYYDATLILP